MKDKQEQLMRAVLSLKTEEECCALLSDLLTSKEREEMANRFLIAMLLDQGKTFLDVVAETGASTATIARVNRCLKYGTGYRTAIDRIFEGEKESELS